MLTFFILLQRTGLPFTFRYFNLFPYNFFSMTTEMDTGLLNFLGKANLWFLKCWLFKFGLVCVKIISSLLLTSAVSLRLSMFLCLPSFPINSLFKISFGGNTGSHCCLFQTGLEAMEGHSEYLSPLADIEFHSRIIICVFYAQMKHSTFKCQSCQ